MSDDPVKKMNKKIAELFLRHEIERNRVVIDELTEALKRDVIDETRNAELNNAKDAAIAELVGECKEFVRVCETQLRTAVSRRGYQRMQAAIAKYDKPTKETK